MLSEIKEPQNVKQNETGLKIDSDVVEIIFRELDVWKLA